MVGFEGSRKGGGCHEANDHSCGNGCTLSGRFKTCTDQGFGCDRCTFVPAYFLSALAVFVHGNVIGVLDQLDVGRRCWNVGQIVIEEHWSQNSSLYHFCFHLSAFRFLLPKMNIGSSVLHIFVEPATDCCRYVDVEDTIEQFLMMVPIVECSCQIKRDEHCTVSRLFS